MGEEVPRRLLVLLAATLAVVYGIASGRDRAPRMKCRLVRLTADGAECACGQEFSIGKKYYPSDTAKKDALLDAFNTHHSSVARRSA